MPDGGLAWAVHRWASGQRLEDVLRGTDLAAGDFVRRCKQVIDLLGQLTDAADPDLAATARRASDSVLRGVVAADRLTDRRAQQDEGSRSGPDHWSAPPTLRWVPARVAVEDIDPSPEGRPARRYYWITESGPARRVVPWRPSATAPATHLLAPPATARAGRPGGGGMMWMG